MWPKLAILKPKLAVCDQNGYFEAKLAICGKIGYFGLKSGLFVANECGLKFLTTEMTLDDRSKKRTKSENPLSFFQPHAHILEEMYIKR